MTGVLRSSDSPITANGRTITNVTPVEVSAVCKPNFHQATPIPVNISRHPGMPAAPNPGRINNSINTNRIPKLMRKIRNHIVVPSKPIKPLSILNCFYENFRTFNFDNFDATILCDEIPNGHNIDSFITDSRRPRGPQRC